MKYKKITLFTLLLLLSCINVFCQNLWRVKQNIDTLTSPAMHGRGACFYGDTLASDFLAKQFEIYNLKPFIKNYYQSFYYNINTFPGRAFIKIGDSALQPGKDYILHPSSGSASKNLSPIYIDSSIFYHPKALKKLLRSDLYDKAVIFETYFLKRKDVNKLLYKKILSAGAWFEITHNKLTASLSPEQLPLPYIQIKEGYLKDSKKRIHIDIEAILVENYSSRNVIGYIPAKIPTDSSIVITAHYDHLGTMGKDTYFPGANDNASGTSMLLELIAHYSTQETTPPYNLVFISFAAEEAGLIGSRYFTENPLFPLNKIKFLVNLDLMGTGDEGMMVVNGAIHEKQFKKIEEINTRKNYLPAIKKRGKAANSDHYFFAEKGVPCFFFYTLGGITAYHDIYDIATTLPLTKFKEVYSLIVDFINEL